MKTQIKGVIGKRNFSDMICIVCFLIMSDKIHSGFSTSTGGAISLFLYFLNAICTGGGGQVQTNTIIHC